MIKDRNALDKPYAMLLQQGNDRAFNYFFNKYVDFVFQFSKSYIKSDVEAEEITQQVFIKLWERRERINPDKSFKNYLFTIVMNTIRDAFNEKAKENEFKLEMFNYMHTNNDEEDKLNFHLYLKVLDELIECLPEKRKEVFILHKKQGLTIHEIATFLNVSPKTVENNYTSAIKELRQGFARKKITGLFLFFV